MECTVCNLDNQAIEAAHKSRFDRLIAKLTSQLKNIKITGAEDLSKIR